MLTLEGAGIMNKLSIKLHILCYQFYDFDTKLYNGNKDINNLDSACRQHIYFNREKTPCVSETQKTGI